MLESDKYDEFAWQWETKDGSSWRNPCKMHLAKPRAEKTLCGITIPKDAEFVHYKRCQAAARRQG